MRFDKKKNQTAKWEEGIGRYVKFALIPAVVIVLIAVIIRMDQPETQDAKEAESTRSGQELLEMEQKETQEAEETELSQPESRPVVVDAIDISRYTLKQDEVEELTELVKAYCEAKEEADPQALAAVFGIAELSEEEAETQKEKMELVKASVKGYENISCYSIEGPEEDSYVVFPYFEIRYREAEVWMPQLTWGYALKDAEGRYYMTQEVSENVASYISRIGEKEDVAALIAQVREAQKAAVEADPRLQSIYANRGASEVVIGGMDS